MGRTILLICALGALTGCNGAGSSGSDAFLKQKRIGNDLYAVTVAPSTPPVAITAAAKDICGKAQQCTVAVFPDGAALPAAFPLTDAEIPILIGTYTLNRLSGMDEYRPATR